MQVAAHDNAPEEFVAWLATQIGETRWIVARRSKARIKQGYDHFFTKRRFMALMAHFDKETAEMTDTVSAHLTEPNMELARQRAETKPGQAYWGGTGPEGKTCRTCARWEADGCTASKATAFRTSRRLASISSKATSARSINRKSWLPGNHCHRRSETALQTKGNLR